MGQGNPADEDSIPEIDPRSSPTARDNGAREVYAFGAGIAV